MTTDSEFIDAIAAIRAGDVATLQRLLADNPGLAASRLGGIAKGRSPLHVVADWPGYFPNGPQVVRMLIEAGADPNARDPDQPGSETPLHWAASSDDVDVASALIDGGANIEVPGGSIGTPLANAVGYGCWHVARLLVGRGGRIGSRWEAAGLGDWARVDEFLAADPPPTSSDIDGAFWQACHGGQRRMAEHLLAQGGSIDAIPGYSEQTAVQVAGAADTRRQILVDWLTERGAAEG